MPLQKDNHLSAAGGGYKIIFSEAESLCGTLELYKEGFLGLLLRPEQLFQVVLSSNG